MPMTDRLRRRLTMTGVILDSGKESNVVCGGCFEVDIPGVRVADTKPVVLVILFKPNDTNILETLGRSPEFLQKTKQNIVTTTSSYL